MFREGVWVGDFVPEIVSNIFPCFRLSPGFFFSPFCFTALTCHLAFWGGGGWAEMTLAGEPVPKVLWQLWQSEAETGNKSTRMEEIDFSMREFRLTLPGGISFLGCLRVQSALHSSMHSLYAFVVWCDIIRDWLQTKTKFCNFNCSVYKQTRPMEKQMQGNLSYFEKAILPLPLFQPHKLCFIWCEERNDRILVKSWQWGMSHSDSLSAQLTDYLILHYGPAFNEFHCCTLCCALEHSLKPASKLDAPWIFPTGSHEEHPRLLNS